MALDGQMAIVTGAGSGLGRAVALQLAREGAAVACADLNETTAAETARAVEDLGPRSLAIGVDVTNRAQVKAMVERVRSVWDRIDILVTSAGIYPRTPIVDLAEEEFDRVLATHVKGTFLCCQAVLPTMIAQRYGRIVTLASGLAAAGAAKSAAYAAGKGGIISFTRVLAREAMPYNITANAVGPGATDTPMVRNNHSPEEIEEQKRRAPFGKLPTAEQSAELVVWFTRPESAHITGRIFVQ
ncbi:MAG TPA: SDR family NAD(P)-dependent oxidoreductase [Chloroflexota bacterium]|jgi:NAD(P)-dependent dehydrogenase (short-subunit alcohol dehydrogenase family)